MGFDFKQSSPVVYGLRNKEYYGSDGAEKSLLASWQAFQSEIPVNARPWGRDKAAMFKDKKLHGTGAEGT